MTTELAPTDPIPVLPGPALPGPVLPGPVLPGVDSTISAGVAPAAIADAAPAASATDAGHVDRASATEMPAVEMPSNAADTLATGVLFMLALSVVQRAVGLGRSILFCRFLDDSQLGQWSLSFSFLLLAAPIVVFGMTGSFARYIEYFRVRGHLPSFLRRTVVAATLMCLAAVTAVVVWRAEFAWLIFKDASQTGLVLLVAGTLTAMIALNFLTETFKALRRARVVSMMELTSSLTFAGLGVLLLIITDWGAGALIAAYGAGCLLASLGAGVLLVRSCWSGFPVCDGPPLKQITMWSKLAPFALWLWVTNVLANLFGMADRYMIIHFSGMEAEPATALVGQYFSSLVVPMLLVAVMGMLSGILLPYLSHDWEAGRRRAVSSKLNLALKLAAVGLTLAGAAIQLLAPWLFQWALAGKYPEGQAVLPWTVTCCAWIGLNFLAHDFLLCAERARLGSLAMLCGLVANIVLNLLLLPWLGLVGAVIATTTANGGTLLLILTLNRWVGMRLDRRAAIVCLLPLSLTLGPAVSALFAAVAVAAALRPRWLLSRGEFRQLEQLAAGYLVKASRWLNFQQP